MKNLEVKFHVVAVLKMDEITRLLIGLRPADKNEVATLANWNPGDNVIVVELLKTLLSAS